MFPKFVEQDTRDKHHEKVIICRCIIELDFASLLYLLHLMAVRVSLLGTWDLSLTGRFVFIWLLNVSGLFLLHSFNSKLIEQIHSQQFDTGRLFWFSWVRYWFLSIFNFQNLGYTAIQSKSRFSPSINLSVIASWQYVIHSFKILMYMSTLLWLFMLVKLMDQKKSLGNICQPHVMSRLIQISHVLKPTPKESSSHVHSLIQ